MTASHTTRLLAEHWFPRPIAILGAHLVIYNCGRTCVSLGQQLSAGAGEQAPWEAAFQRGTDSAVCDSDVESTRLRQPTMSRPYLVWWLSLPHVPGSAVLSTHFPGIGCFLCASHGTPTCGTHREHASWASELSCVLLSYWEPPVVTRQLGLVCH